MHGSAGKAQAQLLHVPRNRRHLAATYANAHAGMTQDPEFAESHGITNGAAWYPVYGGLQVTAQQLQAPSCYTSSLCLGAFRQHTQSAAWRLTRAPATSHLPGAVTIC